MDTLPDRRPLRAALLVAPALVAVGAVSAVGAHKAAPSPIHVGQHAAFTRVVVDLPAGAVLQGGETGVEAVDANPTDGRAAVRARTTGPRTGPSEIRRAGVRVRVRPNPSGFTVLVDAPRDALKFVSYRAPSGGRLVVNLWRNTTAGAARILSDGCLRFDSWGAKPFAVRAKGRELTPLFEHGLVLSIRREGPGQTLIAEKPITATEGVFRPDFSGYAVPGRWHGTINFPPGNSQRVMLEAWSASAKDGSLECLVQTPVIIPAL